MISSFNYRKPGRKAVREEIDSVVNDLLKQPNSPEIAAKLEVLQTLATRMGWHKLFKKIKDRDRAAKWWVDKD